MVNKKRIRMAMLVAIVLLCGSAVHFTAREPQFQIWRYSLQIERAPEQNSEAYYKRGLAYAKKENYNFAIRDYSKVIELEPQQAYAYVSRGIAYAHAEKINLAIDDFTQAIERDGLMAQAYNNRGGMYFVKGEYQRAIEDCTKAIELAGDGKSFFLRGSAYAKMKEYDKAICDYQQSIQRNREFAQAYFALGVVCEKRQQYQEAKNAYTEFIRKAEPDDQSMALAKERLTELP